MRLLIKYPTRSRPKEFLFALDRYVSLLSGKHRVQIVVSADEDDTSMQTENIKSAVLNCGVNGVYMSSIHYGNSKSKIEACNIDMDKAGEWDVVLLASDDMIPQVQGYDDIILSEMQKHFPDTDGMLFFSDGTNCFTSNLCTITIFGRKYYERFGYLYHPDYISFWADNEQTEVAQMLGKCAKIDQVIIKNEHPAHSDLSTGQRGTFINDELYRKNNKFFKSDKAIYERRKQANFDLPYAEWVDDTAPEVSTPENQPILSILIPTVPERAEQFEFLWAELHRQAEPFGEKIELVTDPTPKQSVSIGQKRHNLYAQAKGIYSFQIDDDDCVPSFFIEKVLEALESRPDCVTYQEFCLMDGEPKMSNHSNKYRDWANNQDGFDYVRTPYFKDVIKTEIARKVKVRDMRFGEDHAWSRELKASGLIKTEVHIDEILYFYSHETLKTAQEHRERYGIK